MSIPRTRGAVSGAVLIILGAWGALVPFVGHYFDFVIGSDRAWDFTAGRFWLSLLPGLVVAAGGLLVLLARSRPSGMIGATLALAGGAWFVVGQSFSTLWNDGTSQAGDALGSTGQRAAEELAYFFGLGALVIAVAAFVLGRLAVRSVRDAEFEREAELEAARADRPAPVTTPPAATPVPPREPAARTPAAEPAPEAVTTTGAAARPDAPPAQTETLTAADRVRAAADEPEPALRNILRRRR